MIHHYSQSPEALERWYAGPLGNHIDGFAKLLFDQGYATNTAQTKIRLVADLSRWLERKQLTVRDLDLDENRINEYLKFRANHLVPNRNDKPTFRALLKQLRNDGLIRSSPPAVEGGQIDRIENDYGRYLTQERGLTQSTLAKYLPIMRRFLIVRFGNSLISLEELSPDDITQFILHHAQACGRRHSQVMMTALRSFLHFVYQKGQTPTDLSTCVPTVANWSLSELQVAPAGACQVDPVL